MIPAIGPQTACFFVLREIQSRAKAGPKPGQSRAKAEPKPGQSRAKARPKPGQSRAKVGPRPGQSRAKAGPRLGQREIPYVFPFGPSRAKAKSEKRVRQSGGLRIQGHSPSKIVRTPSRGLAVWGIIIIITII